MERLSTAHRPHESTAKESGQDFGLDSISKQIGKKLVEAGKIQDAAVWAENSVRNAEELAGGAQDNTQGVLIDAFIERGDLLVSMGHEQEAKASYEKYLEILKGLARTKRYFFSSFPGPYRDAALELDNLWHRLILEQMEKTNLSTAAQIANDANTYWKRCFQENRNIGGGWYSFHWSNRTT